VATAVLTLQETHAHCTSTQTPGTSLTKLKYNNKNNVKEL